MIFERELGREGKRGLISCDKKLFRRDYFLWRKGEDRSSNGWKKFGEYRVMEANYKGLESLESFEREF